MGDSISESEPSGIVCSLIGTYVWAATRGRRFEPGHGGAAAFATTKVRAVSISAAGRSTAVAAAVRAGKSICVAPFP